MNFSEDAPMNRIPVGELVEWRDLVDKGQRVVFRIASIAEDHALLLEPWPDGASGRREYIRGIDAHTAVFRARPEVIAEVSIAPRQPTMDNQ